MHFGFQENISIWQEVTMSTMSKEKATGMHYEATELRLGLPGFQSLHQGSSSGSMIISSKFIEKPLFPLHPLSNIKFPYDQKNFLAGKKRGFSYAMGNIYAPSDEEIIVSPQASSKREVKSGPLKEKPIFPMDLRKDLALASCVSSKTHMESRSIPAFKVQVMGWPPITTSRRNSLTAYSKNTSGTRTKGRSGTLFVKVSMDGAPYLRKVDLNSYTTYHELSFSLEKLFRSFTIGQHEPDHKACIKNVPCESVLTDQLRLSEYVLTYEDRDEDWMLVGDVPWEMFTNNCKRLRIMKVTDAIGLAPRAGQIY